MSTEDEFNCTPSLEYESDSQDNKIDDPQVKTSINDIDPAIVKEGNKISDVLEAPHSILSANDECDNNNVSTMQKHVNEEISKPEHWNGLTSDQESMDNGPWELRPRSNLDLNNQQIHNMEIDDVSDLDDESKYYDTLHDPELQRDAADHLVVFFVCVALFFFVILFGFSVIGSILLLKKFGVVGMAALLCLVSALFSVIYGVWRVINEEPKYEPVKRKFNKCITITRAVVEREIQAIQMDLREMYLLRNEPEHDSNDFGEHYDNMDSYMESDENEKNPPPPEGREKKRYRSFILKVVSAPFGGLKKFQDKNKGRKKGFSFKHKKENSKRNEAEMDLSAPNYVPPIV